MALHMNFGPCGDYDMHAGGLAYSAHTMMPSADEFRITIKGKASTAAPPISARLRCQCRSEHRRCAPAADFPGDPLR